MLVFVCLGLPCWKPMVASLSGQTPKMRRSNLGPSEEGHRATGSPHPVLQAEPVTGHQPCPLGARLAVQPPASPRDSGHGDTLLSTSEPG